MTCNVEHRPSLISDERGLSTVEYVILLCLIGVASLGIWSSVGSDIKTRLSAAEGVFSATVPVPTP